MKKEIYFAGGCFWGVEAYFKNIKGVLATKTGYANGNTVNPSYEELCSGVANHAETVKVIYDDSLTSLPILLMHFFRIINPYTLNKQGNDEGIQYRSGIYYVDTEDISTITSYIANLQEKSNKAIVVAVEKLTNFYLAEEYHQDYLTKNPSGYCHVDLSLLRADEKK